MLHNLRLYRSPPFGWVVLLRSLEPRKGKKGFTYLLARMWAKRNNMLTQSNGLPSAKFDHAGKHQHGNTVGA